MTLQEYLKNEFPKDLGKLDSRKPGSMMTDNPDSFRIDNNTIYFGGKDWKNIEQDIAYIDPTKREYFFLCLFTITIIDLTMFTYYNDFYIDFRKLTAYPKFGWSGFGPHYENPKKLLNIPEQIGLLNRNKIEMYIEDFIDMFVEMCNSFFANNLPHINSNDFLSKIIHDEDFTITDNDKNSLFEMVIIKLKERLNIQ